MSQSPLAPSARRQLPRFAHTPSQLAKSTSSRHLSASSSSQTSQIGLTTTSKTSHDTSSVPHTPKITYSPYATSSPHGGLSKSTSIPFDMAGSARAGRKAEQDRARGVLNGAMEEPEKPVVRTPRFVRRKPFWQRYVIHPSWSV